MSIMHNGEKVLNNLTTVPITQTINSTSTETQIPSAKAVNELNIQGTLIDQSVINKYGTEIIKYPLGRWHIGNNDIAMQFSDIPWNTACIIDIMTTGNIEGNPWDNVWSFRIYKAQTIEKKGTFVRQLESRYTAGVLFDTGWQRVCTTSVADVPVTDIAPTFPSTITLGNMQKICYSIKNGWANVSILFSLLASPKLNWTTIAEGLPKPDKEINSSSFGETAVNNASVGFRLSVNGILEMLIGAEITQQDWWNINFSYPVAES